MTNIMDPTGTATGYFTSYTSALKVRRGTHPLCCAATSFTATSPGNDTLDLGYNIFGPDGTPGGILTSMTVSLYTSASGVFEDNDNVPIASSP